MAELATIYCIRCGAQNSADAFFCQKCGTGIEDEVETRVARRSDAVGRHIEESPRQYADDEFDGDRIFTVGPTLLFVKVGYGAAALGAVLLVALASMAMPQVSPYILIPLGMLLLLVPAFYHFRQKLTTYTLTDTTIEIDNGIISRTTKNIPLRRVQDVTVTCTILQRIFRFGDIVIDNASEDGGKIVLKNIDSPRRYADQIMRQIRRLDR
jgi:membrane protein YdbS with pleckstrin-like domain